MTSSKPNARSSILQFALIFLVIYTGTQLLLPILFPNTFGPEARIEGVFLKVQDATVKEGHHPILLLQNKTQEDLVLPDTCPMPPVQVYAVAGGEKVALQTTETVLPCEPLTSVAAGQTAMIDLAPWKYSLFGGLGQYETVLDVTSAESGPVPGPGPESDNNGGPEPEPGPDTSANDVPQGESVLSVQFSIHEAGPITRLFRAVVTKPLLNLLIFIASVLPGHSLGWSIILLTLLIKLLLFFPTQHAMEGQRKLQKLQPRMDELRKKYKDKPEQLNKEIMNLWKENHVNPMQSCLPILIQFPVLIGLFFVIRDGSVLELSKHLIYGFNESLTWSFGTNFLGLDLLKPSFYLFPPLLVALQFSQMKLSFAIAKKKQDTRDKKQKTKEQLSQQELQQRMMLYGLPLMIGFFAFQFPAAVSLYWAISTIFAIGQQLVVNRKV